MFCNNCKWKFIFKICIAFFLIKRKDSEGGEIWEVRPNK